MNQRVRYLGVFISTIGMLLAFLVPFNEFEERNRNWFLFLVAFIIGGGIIIADYPYKDK